MSNVPASVMKAARTVARKYGRVEPDELIAALRAEPLSAPEHLSLSVEYVSRWQQQTKATQGHFYLLIEGEDLTEQCLDGTLPPQYASILARLSHTDRLTVRSLPPLIELRVLDYADEWMKLYPDQSIEARLRELMESVQFPDDTQPTK